MKAATALPFRVISTDAITLGPWQIEAAGEKEILEEAIPGWDYQAPIDVSRSFSIDTDQIRSDTRLQDGSTIMLSVIAVSPAARFRSCVAQSAEIAVGGQTIEGQLNATLDSTRICEKLILTTELVLVGAAERHPFVAHLPGSRLYQEHFPVQLEGSASRFPMTTLNFEKDLSRLRIARAKWYLWSGQLDYSVPVTQGLMLYVNSGRQEVLDAVTNNDPLTLASMSVDVARQLLASAVADDEFDLDYSLYPENSVGNAICGLMLTCFPDMEKDRIVKLRDTDPGQFEAMIQSAIL